MKIYQFILIIFSVTLLSIGQIIFKMVSQKINIDENVKIFSILLSPILVLALFVYGIATITWIVALSQIQLHVAYPFAALAFLIVPLLSYYFLGEPLNIYTFIGGGVILLGVFISLMK